MKKKDKRIWIGVLVVGVLVVVGGWWIWNSNEGKTYVRSKCEYCGPDCSLAALKLNPNLVEIDNSIKLLLSNIGEIELEYLIIKTYSNEDVKSCNATPSSIDIAEVKEIMNSSECLAFGEITKIRVETELCPGLFTQIEKVNGVWVLEE